MYPWAQKGEMILHSSTREETLPRKRGDKFTRIFLSVIPFLFLSIFPILPGSQRNQIPPP